MITLTREEAQQVLENFNALYFKVMDAGSLGHQWTGLQLADNCRSSIGLLCARLAQPEPDRKEWQRITDHEADEYWDESVSTGCRLSFGLGVDYANRVLREKNT